MDGFDYIILQRSVSDFEDITVSIWVKPSVVKGTQPVWSFGADADNYMQLEIDNGTPLVIARKGSVTEKLAGSEKISEGTWTQITFALKGDTATMCVNGKQVATGTMTINPDQLLAPNVNSIAQQNYLGRGIDGKYFTGAIDNFSIFSKGMDCVKSTVLKAVEEELDKGEKKLVADERRQRRR